MSYSKSSQVFVDERARPPPPGSDDCNLLTTENLLAPVPKEENLSVVLWLRGTGPSGRGIQEAIQLANLDAARRMELKPGDRVVGRVTNAEQMLQEALGEKWESLSKQIQREDEVSSIREDGQVFFKGGGQAPARYLDKLTACE